FNPNTKIKFSLPQPLNGKSKSAKVKLIVYDIRGTEIAVLVNEELKPGEYEIDFEESALSSGIYFYSLITNDFKETKKMILIK
ncbi:MAG: T9SS type A sorting domain-containing protein, partial [Ignavibacteria bacterium]